MEYSGKLFVLDSNILINCIKKMFGYAKEYLVLACPFWESNQFIEEFSYCLFDALSRNVHIILICRSKDYFHLSENLDDIHRPNLHIYISDKFHAKFYFNDSAYLITSSNMSKSVGNELGVLLLDKNSQTLKKLMTLFTCSLLNDEDCFEFLSYIDTEYYNDNFDDYYTMHESFPGLDDDYELPY